MIDKNESSIARPKRMSVLFFLEEGATLPKKSTDGAAAYDVYAQTDFYVKPFSRSIVPTGIHTQLPYGTEIKIEPRSGYSAKGFEGFVSVGDEKPIRVLEADVVSGKVDCDYIDGIGVIVRNLGNQGFWIKEGQRIAQMTLYNVGDIDFNVVESLDKFEKTGRTGGFGHSGSFENKN